MQGESVGRKRGHLHSIVGRIGAETIIKSKRPANNNESLEEKFINPLLLNNPKFEIQEIEPREPSKKTKIYILQRPAGLTNGAYLSCSSCGRHAFKLYRVVKTKLAPKHLQKFGATENDLLRICKRCWYQGNNSELQPKELATRPFFQNESPLGATNRRACSGWHFLRRDLIKKRLCCKNDGGVRGHCNNRNNEKEEELASIVTLIVNEGNSFHKQKNGVSLFSHDGTWFGLDEARYYGQSRSVGDKQMVLDFDRHSFESLVCDNFQLGNYVEPQAALIDHDYTSLFSEVEVKTEESIKKVNKGIRAKKAAVKLLKHSIKKSKSGSAKTPLKNLKASHPLSRENKNRTRVIQKASVTERPPQAAKPSRGSNDKQCVLCHVPILKSYGSYRRENAPDKLKGLFTNGVITVRACRRCVPYQRPLVSVRGGKVKRGQKKMASFQRKEGKAKTNAAEKPVSPSSRATVKTKAPSSLHIVISNSSHTASGTQDNAKQARGGKGTNTKVRSRTEAVRIDLTCSEEEGISTGIENKGVLKANQQRVINKSLATKTGASGPHRCVVCSRPVGKSYRRCLINEVPPCYRYVFQQHKGEPRLRICRKCLSRKNYPKAPGERPSDG